VNSKFKLTLLVTALALGGCSSLETDKLDYRSSIKAPPLSVPPDLTQLSKDTKYALVDGAVSSVGLKTAQSTPDKGVAIGAMALADMRVERAGTQRWLVIKRPAEPLWTPIKDFWQESGFVLVQEQRELGIMETDWAENRAKLPQDFVRATLGKVLDSLYSTGERDKFRTRIETNSKGETEIFISHRGVAEVYSKETKDQTMWQVRPSEPELEAELLQRLMIKLGTPADQAKSLINSTTAASVSTIASANGRTVLKIQEGFDRAWRRVGLALDRTGFTVEDRDRNRGIYFVRYVDATKDKTDTGFFARLFSSKPKPNEANKYQILIEGNENSATVTVLNAQGQPDNSETTQRIVKVLANDIK